MSLRINHNIDSIVGQRNLAMNSMNMSKSLQRLSSGLRINSAADNPAGLVISEQMRAQITGLNQAINNTQNGVSMVQTAEGALDEVNSLLNKARQLTLDAANTGVNDVNQLNADQSELDNVIASISRIGQVTQFGTKNILNGSLNGATSLSSGLSNVKVGNLANNSAIAAGQATLAVTGGAKEATALGKKSGTNSVMFDSTISGLKMQSAKVKSGVSVALTINSTTVNYTVTGGGLKATGLATKLNALVTSQGYGVTANANGEMVVTRAAYGATDFTSSITFSKGASGQITGTKEAVTATLRATSPSANDNSATLMFGASDLSGVTTASTVKCGVVFGYTLKTATGFTVTVTTGVVGLRTTTGQKALSAILSGLQTSIRGQNKGFSGAVVSLVAGGANSGLQVKVTRGADSILTDFQFTLNVDYKSNNTAKSEAHTVSLTGIAFQTGTNSTFRTSTGGLGIINNAISGTTVLRSGAAMSMTVNGQTVTLTGLRSMTALATAFQSAIAALTGLSAVKVEFKLTGNYTGLASEVGITGAIGKRGFVVYNTDGKDLNVSLRVDQLEGLDKTITGVEGKAGVVAPGATLNLTTVAQARITGITSSTGVAAQSLASQVSGSTFTSGGSPTAKLTSSNGVSLNLKTSFTTATGAIQLTLVTGQGYQGFSAEVTKTLATNGGSTTFTLSNGAEFQIGSNGGQTVGLTIDAVSAGSLGRNVTTALSSLEDLLSSKKGALTNGLHEEALQVIDAAINEITNQRGSLGAFQTNTLQSSMNSLAVSSQNLTAAESTIRDVDFAQESANFTKNQIMVQASTSMLAQANQMPQSVLKLLG